ncbi:MAG: TIGR03087 family PEP-CTERM/XrtA system glycosyltransferase [Nitrospirota bacterium]
MNILYLSHRIPYPPNKGDKIRTFNILKYLSRRHNIYLGTILDQESDKKYIPTLRQYCKEIHAAWVNRKRRLFQNVFQKKPFSVACFYHESLQHYVDRVLDSKQIDVVICFCSPMAEYIFNTPIFRQKAIDNIKLIMDYIDLDSDKWLQYAHYSRFPFRQLYELENKRLFKYEVRINHNFDYSLFVSQREEDKFRALYPGAKSIKVIPNGIDYKYFNPNHSIPLRDKRPNLVFTGFMNYFANEDGVNWFCRHIYPRIKAEIPEARFYIVGSSPTKKVKDLAKIEGVTVTGYIDDIRYYYAIADVCVIPLRIARGLQNKVLEAMSMGKAVVATSNAKNGIMCRDKVDIVIADEEEDFAREIIFLLKDESRRKELGLHAIENIRRNYSWPINLKMFDEILAQKKPIVSASPHQEWELPLYKQI